MSGARRQLTQTVEEARFAGFLELSPDALVIVNQAGVIVFVNRQTEMMFGYPREELLGRVVEILVPTRFHDQHILDRNAYIASPYLSRFHANVEVFGQRKDGTDFPVEISLSPMRSDNDLFVLSTIRDITERRRAEAERERLLEQLAAERSWLRAVIERSPTGILLLEGPDGARVTGNRRAEELLGRPIVPEGGFHQFVVLIAGPDGKPLPADQYAPRRALAGEGLVGVERLIQRSDGRTVPILVSAGPIRGDEGKILGAVLVFEDISAIKELEQRREEWVSVIAHDLRQPVTVIDGYASLLERSGRRAPNRAGFWIEQIHQSAKRLQRMIGDLLDVSRIEAHRLELLCKEIDLVQLAREVSDQMMAIAPDRSIHLETTEERLLVEADPVRLQQLLTNLLSNAVKYGYPKTEIRITLARSGGEARVSVSNRGDGITPEDLSTLFARFKRTRQAQEKQIKGVGLGLYISKGLVEAHGGRIWAESTPGQTTTFHFTLPIAQTLTPK